MHTSISFSVHQFIPPFTHRILFIHQLTYPFIYSSIHAIIHLLIHQFTIHKFIHTLTHPSSCDTLNHSSTHPPIDPSFLHPSSIVYPFNHPSIHLYMHPCISIHSSTHLFIIYSSSQTTYSVIEPQNRLCYSNDNITVKCSLCNLTYTDLSNWGVFYINKRVPFYH